MEEVFRDPGCLRDWQSGKAQLFNVKRAPMTGHCSMFKVKSVDH